MKLSMILASLAASFSIEDNAPEQRNMFKVIILNLFLITTVLFS